jgi:hypothetical protein
VQSYAPELDKRCRPHLKPTNKSYRTDDKVAQFVAIDSAGKIAIHLGETHYARHLLAPSIFVAKLLGG